MPGVPRARLGCWQVRSEEVGEVSPSWGSLETFRDPQETGVPWFVLPSFMPASSHILLTCSSGLTVGR